MGNNAEACKKWREANPEKYKAGWKRWREAHPEKVKEYNHRQYLRRKALRQEQKKEEGAGSGEQ